jgi:hypothetical protein
MGYDYYKKLNQRNQIDVVRRACLNTPALVAYDSIPERFKKKIVEKIGDPYKKAAKSALGDLVFEDEAARKFFRDYLMDNGDHLPDDVQLQYYTNVKILNALHSIITDRAAARKAIGGKLTGIWPKLADAVSKLDKTVFNHSLPNNHRRLQDRYNRYKATDYSKYDRIGYESLISGKWGNKNSEKINDEAKIWILSRWTSMVDRIATENQLLNEYNQLAETQGWKGLKSVDAIHNFLYQEDVKPMWWASRYGELKAKEKFAYQQKTVLPTMRDSLWYSDGTKLNYYYQARDAQGRFVMRTTSVYEVMDVYSEALVGYHISDTEDYVAQYSAYRMALEFSQHKPYQITYDNQGGHKKLEAGDFLSKLSHLSIRTKPYNGKSKTIENAFYRYQAEFLKKDWYFTGQNIQSKKAESKANLEFIMANKHNLPTLEEIKARYVKRRNEWNNAPHPKTGKPRIEMYKQSHNPKAVKLEMMDMVDMFWVLREKPVKCSAWGISFTEQKVKHDYMVMLPNGLPDVRWLARNIDRKFRIKFDPQDFSMIYLYEDTPQGLRFITAADQKVEVHRGKQEQEDWEASWMKAVDTEIDNMRIEMLEEIRSIQEKHNQLPEQHGLKTPAIKGISKKKQKATKQSSDNFGRVQKAMSNAVAAGTDEEDFNEDDLYKLM